MTPIICGMPLIASNSLAKTSNLYLLGNWRKIFCMCTLTNLQNSLAITHGVFYDPHSTPRVHNVFLVLSFVLTMQPYYQFEYIFLYACMLLCKNGPNFLQRNQNVTWETHVLCLNIFLIEELDNNVFIKSDYILNAHLVHCFTFIVSK